MNAYIEDEFDRLARERQTLGAHRKPRRVSPWLIALVAVLVIAPLVGWGIGLWAASDSASEDDANPPATSQTEQQAPAEQPVAPESTEENPAGQPTPQPTEPVLNKDVSVQVLNGSGVNGAAGQTAEMLGGQGYTAVEPGDYTAGLPTETTVYYRNAGSIKEAEDIAKNIEGATVDDGSDLGLSADIVVVLR
ncbi:LytR C-terminal domain-containing protein [Arcanobacterium phocisimile]|uniref:LytR C-terminal domain-containing protein n=1 Tax=Arcanobacterium phocisimile TaxID=1302235 RepID=A0ABX7IHI9_9ACTO|nr:LytR C-terminal domain-containing protein [Arcanobacterium phocisimile]QRV02019.1 LytR C-terminal domain-containing protein [Arcanobacterium phocisimile]